MGTSVTLTGITFNDATTQSTAAVSFPTGTLMLFQQTAAPTGWTKQTTHNDKVLRVVSGTASSGGTSAFTTVFANQTPTITVGATTLTTTQIPSHNHTWIYGPTPGSPSTTGMVNTDGTTTLPYQGQVWNGNLNTFTAMATNGSGGSHTHSGTSTAITLNVQYVDLIIASKT